MERAGGGRRADIFAYSGAPVLLAQTMANRWQIRGAKEKLIATASRSFAQSFAAETHRSGFDAAKRTTHEDKYGRTFIYRVVNFYAAANDLCRRRSSRDFAREYFMLRPIASEIARTRYFIIFLRQRCERGGCKFNEFR